MLGLLLSVGAAFFFTKGEFSMGEVAVLDSAKIRDAMHAKRFTITELSKRAGVSYQTARRILKQDNTMRIANALKVADALEVSVEDLRA